MFSIYKQIRKIGFRLSCFTFGFERTVKTWEYVTGLYRYPKRMVLRNIDWKRLPTTDVLVFVAHPDDEVLGISATLMRARKKNKRVTVVYATDGTGKDWVKSKEEAKKIAQTRYEEGVRALSLIDITKDHLLSLGFPDKGIQRYLNELTEDVMKLMTLLRPKEVYVHCIEGGHSDHDLVSAVVKLVCRNLQYDSLYEWPEYSAKYPIGSTTVRFLKPLHFHEQIKELALSDKEFSLKKKMIDCHASQSYLISHFVVKTEYIRQANCHNVYEELETYSNVLKSEAKDSVMNYLKKMTKRKAHISPIFSIDNAPNGRLQTKEKKAIKKVSQ